MCKCLVLLNIAEMVMYISLHIGNSNVIIVALGEIVVDFKTHHKHRAIIVLRTMC
jgi:hypothetical protein